MGRTRSNKTFGDSKPPPKLEFEKRRSGRGANPTCTHFGVGQKRIILHPSGYFCSNCEWYESQILSGGGKRIKRDSRMYACQANHYDWVYPREKWTVSGNHFMSVEDIRKEEERCRLKEVAEKRARRKQKYEAMISDLATVTADDEDNSVVAGVLMANDEEADESACEFVIDGDNNIGLSDGECSDAAPEVALLGATNMVSNMQQMTAANNHTVIIEKLKESVAALRKELRHMQQHAQRWKTRYMEVAGAHGEGAHLVECASKAIEQLMHSEDRYMRSSGRRGEKARKEYRKAIGLSIWTNESSFY